MFLTLFYFITSNRSAGLSSFISINKILILEQSCGGLFACTCLHIQEKREVGSVTGGGGGREMHISSVLVLFASSHRWSLAGVGPLAVNAFP